MMTPNVKVRMQLRLVSSPSKKQLKISEGQLGIKSLCDHFRAAAVFFFIHECLFPLHLYQNYWD